MRLKNILDAVADSFSDCQFYIQNENCEVEFVDLGGMKSDVKKGVLLYMQATSPEDSALSDENCCIFTTESTTPAKNQIIAPNLQRAMELFHTVQEIFSRANQLGALAAHVLREPMTLQEIVDNATEILGNPIFIVDLSHKILAVSQVEVEDQSWKQEFSQGYYHAEAGRRELYQTFLNNAQQGKFLDVIDDESSRPTSIRCALLSGNNLLGELRVSACFRPFTPMDLELARMLGSLISVELLRHTIPFTISTTGDYLVLDLILGNLTDERNITDRLRFMNWTPKTYKYLLLISWEQPELNLEQTDAQMSAIASLIGNAHSVLHENKMVFLFDQDQELNLHSELVHKMQVYLESVQMVGVLSMPFQQMSEAAYRYEQTQRVMELNQEINRADRFQQVEACAFELMLDQAGQKYDLFDYCHPLVRRLLEYDHANGTDHCKFLEAYIFSGRSYSKAAAMLYTHRNTVIYRMKHIEELLDFNFASEEYVFHLELSFRMLRYINAVKDARMVPKKDTMATFY